MIEETVEQLEKMFKISTLDLKDIDSYQIILNDLWIDSIGNGENQPKKIEGKIECDIPPKEGEHDWGFVSTYFFGAYNKKYRTRPNLSVQVDHIIEDVKQGTRGVKPKINYFEVEATYRGNNNLKIVVDSREEKIKISMEET